MALLAPTKKTGRCSADSRVTEKISLRTDGNNSKKSAATNVPKRAVIKPVKKFVCVYAIFSKKYDSARNNEASAANVKSRIEFPCSILLKDKTNPPSTNKTIATIWNGVSMKSSFK